MSPFAEAHDILKASSLDRVVDAAAMDGRVMCAIDAAQWDKLYPAVRLLCGRAFREMHTPWRAFMYDGKWIERAK